MAEKKILHEDLILHRLAKLGLIISDNAILPEEVRRQLMKEYLSLRLDISLWMSYKGDGLRQRYLTGTTQRLLNLRKVMKAKLRAPNQRKKYYDALYEIQYQIEMLLICTNEFNMCDSLNMQ